MNETAGLTRHSVRSDGAEIAVWQRSGTDPTLWVLFVAGAGVDHRMFEGQVDALDERFNLLLPDMRGQGESTLEPGHRATLDTLVADVVTLLDRFAVKRASLVGHSFGGNVVQEVAHRHPARVDRLVMIGSPGQHRVPAPGERKKLDSFARFHRLFPWRMFADFSARSCSRDTETRAYVRECLVRTGRETWVDLSMSGYRALCDLDTLPRAPTLLMRGELDMPTELDAIFDDVERHRPDTTTRVLIPGVGHQPPQGDPDEVNRHLVVFLDPDRG